MPFLLSAASFATLVWLKLHPTRKPPRANAVVCVYKMSRVSHLNWHRSDQHRTRIRGELFKKTDYVLQNLRIIFVHIDIDEDVVSVLIECV